MHLTNLNSIGAALLNLMPPSYNGKSVTSYIAILWQPFAVIQIFGALLSVVRKGSAPWNICSPSDFLLAGKNHVHNQILSRHLNISQFLNFSGSHLITGVEITLKPHQSTQPSALPPTEDVHVPY